MRITGRIPGFPQPATASTPSKSFSSPIMRAKKTDDELRNRFFPFRCPVSPLVMEQATVNQSHAREDKFSEMTLLLLASCSHRPLTFYVISGEIL